MLVDDHTLIRTSIRYMLESLPRFEVVCEVSDGREAVERAGQHGVDLIVMDVQMPRMDGIAATRALRDRGLTVPILMLSTHDELERVREALAAGATGYCLKSETRDELVRAIDATAAGLPFLSSLLPAAVAPFAGRPRPPGAPSLAP
jgi:DNA-binding NarL/FixJ family response regulator